jgi:fluoroacetyl-CoA thioesterase
MSKPVPAGARAELEETVQFNHTLTSHYAQLPPVYSTPDMVRLMETACFLALQPYAEGDEITVGTHIDVRHTAACGIGAMVKAEAVMESFDGRFYIMRVRAWAEENGRSFDIGDGRINRAFVSVGKFLERLKVRGA